jgi:hypothetical protein
MSEIIGYVENNYKLNSTNGLYTCTLYTCNPIKSNGKPPEKPPLSFIIDTSPPTITQQIDLIPINNTFGITSPNIPSQMIVMSKDSKFIFIESKRANSEYIKYLYIFIYGITKYRVPVPNFIHLLAVVIADMLNLTEATDDVYSKLPDDSQINNKIKHAYKAYLISSNPGKELLSLDSNVNSWKNVSYIFYTQYKCELDNTLIPNTTCIDIEMDTPPDSLKNSDCRNVKDGKNYIIPKYELSDTSDLLKTNSQIFMIVIGVILFVCLCSSSVAGFFLIKKSSGKSRGGYQYYHY